MTLNDISKPGQASNRDPELEKIVEALERDGLEAQRPKAVPYGQLQKMAQLAAKSEEARDDLTDTVQGEIFSALIGALDVPTGAGLAGVTWLRGVIGPTIALAMAHKARVDKNWDAAGTFLAFVVTRCVREALLLGGAAEFRASDPEIADALGVSPGQVRRARERVQRDGGVPFLTIDSSKRTKPRYALGSIPAMTMADNAHIRFVLDRMIVEGHLRATTRPIREGSKSTETKTPDPLDCGWEPVENTKTKAPQALVAKTLDALDQKMPKDCAGNGASSKAPDALHRYFLTRSMAPGAEDEIPLKGDQNSRARAALSSNISGQEPIGLRDAPDVASPLDGDAAPCEEAHAPRGTAIAVRSDQEEIKNQQAAIAPQGAPDRAQEGCDTYPLNTTLHATPVEEPDNEQLPSWLSREGGGLSARVPFAYEKQGIEHTGTKTLTITPNELRSYRWKLIVDDATLIRLVTGTFTEWRSRKFAGGKGWKALLDDELRRALELQRKREAQPGVPDYSESAPEPGHLDISWSEPK